MGNKPKEKIDYKLVMETLDQVEKRKDTIKTILADNDPALETITKLQGEISEIEKVIESKKAEIASILEGIEESDNRISTERDEISQLLLSINIDPLTYDLGIPNLPAVDQEPVKRRRRKINRDITELSLEGLHEEALNKTLDDIGGYLSLRTYNALKNHGIKTLGELRALPSHVLVTYRMIGKDALSQIEAMFKHEGILKGRY